MNEGSLTPNQPVFSPRLPVSPITLLDWSRLIHEPGQMLLPRCNIQKPTLELEPTPTFMKNFTSSCVDFRHLTEEPVRYFSIFVTKSPGALEW